MCWLAHWNDESGLIYMMFGMKIWSIHRIKLLFVFIFILGVLVAVTVIQSPPVLRTVMGKFHTSVISPDIVYSNNTKIPRPPNGRLWPEDAYLYDKNISNIRELADPGYSSLRLEGQPEVRLGDTVHVTVTLYDGYNKRKKTGGDLVRVWMRERSIGAGSNGKVVDNNDGSYSAILSAFWVGQPEIVAAIISPREVISFALKRRYILPYVLMNTAIFKRTKGRTVTEETPCNYDAQIPGYKICNLTAANYGMPWYCGKPRSPYLSCDDWTLVANINLWQTGIEQKRLTSLEAELLSVQRRAMVLAEKIQLNVTKKNNQQLMLPSKSCNHLSPSQTWVNGPPTGYFYKWKWYGKYCRRKIEFDESYKRCLQNSKILAIGDSTMSQIFVGLKSVMNCEFKTKGGLKKMKHHSSFCINSDLNFNLTYGVHQQPFCTHNRPPQYFKSLQEYSGEVGGHQQRTIIILTIFSHFLNMHSHVFYENVVRMRRDVANILQQNSNVTVVIKGPHAYSFGKNTDAVLWMPDIYASMYQDFLYEIFQGLDDRVIYINTLDMTVSSEQWHIHADNYVISEIVMNILGYIC